MAAGLGVPELNVSDMTNEKCKNIMLEMGKDRNLTLNPMKGIKGSFYQDSRKEDLMYCIKEILEERR